MTTARKSNDNVTELSSNGIQPEFEGVVEIKFNEEFKVLDCSRSFAKTLGGNATFFL